MERVSRALSFLLLGEEPLLTRCGEVLRERGHYIVAVVTRHSVVKAWCRERGIRAIERHEYSALLDNETVDVLLSITHPALISPADIAKASRAALNFHDGPLPRYAGMNASAWAIFHGERSHAIVWHHLTAGIDEGSVVLRCDVAVEGRETSVSLNMKNASLALESFRVLVGRLEENELAGELPNGALGRQLFSRHDRPEALCTVDFEHSADDIDRLVRACDFGHYPNRFGLAKVEHQGRAVIVREAVPIPNTGAPGRVLRIADEFWEVTCGSRALRLSKFANLLGVPLPAREAAAALGIAAGERLAPGGQRERKELSRSVAEAEPFFVKALSNLAPLSLRFAGTRDGNAAHVVAVDAVPRFATRFGARASDAFIAVFGVLLSASCRQDTFDLALVDAEARASIVLSAAMFFPAVPLRMTIDSGARFGELVGAVHEARTALSARRPFLFDLVARHPVLAAEPALLRGELSAAAVLVGQADPPAGAALAMKIADGQVSLISDGTVSEACTRALSNAMACMVRRLADEPDASVSSIDLLSEQEMRQQIFAWNDTGRSFPDTLRIHDLFEQQVLSRPNAIALVCGGKSKTFAEVERKANRVANALIARGVGPGSFVGLALPRGFDLVSALLGVAKSGAAYVPIDLGYPADRVRFMLADAGCNTVLGTSAGCLEIPADRMLLVDGPLVRAASVERPFCPATAGDVCYAIYTSGSTGEPKGVVLTHRAVVNTIDWVNRTFAVGPDDRLLFVTSPSFDLSVYDVFGALGAGASIEIASESLLAEPRRLVDKLCEAGITIWDSAPPALARLVPFLPESAGCSTLRLFLLSGDWIPVGLPARLKKTFERSSVESLGGATEAAIWSNHFPVRHVDPAWTSIPYGRPIQNARYYVLDWRLRPVPVTIPGDLYIGGVCLAEGYLNRPELTAERFFGDPFVPGERIYRTGDLARYWDDGTLEFLGRADYQVKIRGYRVELGEVEHAISALPNVREAICSTHVDSAGQNSLVAYVVGADGARPSETHMRSALSRSLPDYMVPSHFVALAALPLSPNGKLDRTALPGPKSSRGTANSYVAPRTELEQKLSAIWEELLQKRPIGITEDFFALGGHSLLAVMLVTRLRSQLGIDVPLSRVLEKPTIAAFAASMPDECGPLRQSHHLFALHEHGSRPPLVLVAGVGGYGFTYRNFPELLGGDQPVFTFQAIGAEEENEPSEISIEETARIYEIELLRVSPAGPLVLGGFSFGMLSAFELARRLIGQGREIPLLVSLDGFAPGYPALLPWRERISAHVAEFVGRDGPARRAYLKHRAVNVRSRLLRIVGLDDNERLAPDIPLADPKMRERMRKLWAIHLRSRQSYHPQARLPCDLLLIKAGTGEHWIATKMDDPLYGWSDFVSGAISVLTVPGEHADLLDPKFQPRIAQELATHIDRLTRRRASVRPPGAPEVPAVAERPRALAGFVESHHSIENSARVVPQRLR